MDNKSAQWERGYKEGRQGAQYLNSRNSNDYAEGYDAGECDRPTLEELTYDFAKEVSDPLGY